MKYRTTSLQQSAAILADANLDVTFVQLELTDKSNKFKFVLEVNAEKDTLDKWINDYTNERIFVEPKKYDAKLNILRDNLSLYKN